jgi:hypothetical protein
VHSLEHDYVIFGYNCQPLDPWDTIDAPVVMTSWGRLHRFETFNVDEAVSFVERNLNKSPEPNGP